MTAIAREMRASYAFVERNWYLTKRYWGWEIAWLIYSIASAKITDKLADEGVQFVHIDRRSLGQSLISSRSLGRGHR